MAATGQRVDPYRAFFFHVEIEGISQARFSDCSGLGSTTEVIDRREFGSGTGPYKIPGRTTFSDITLKWGVTGSFDLWDWRQQIIDGTIVRKNGSIVVHDMDNHSEVSRWNFFNAWPTKWEGPTFNVNGNEVAVDTLVLAHERLLRVKV